MDEKEKYEMMQNAIAPSLSQEIVAALGKIRTPRKGECITGFDTKGRQWKLVVEYEACPTCGAPRPVQKP